MNVTQTVEIPDNHMLTVEVPCEIPAGKAILTFTAVSADGDFECARGMQTGSRANPEEIKIKLQNLQGSLGKSAFGALDGVAYQRKVREEWDH